MEEVDGEESKKSKGEKFIKTTFKPSRNSFSVPAVKRLREMFLVSSRSALRSVSLRSPKNISKLDGINSEIALKAFKQSVMNFSIIRGLSQLSFR